MLCVWVKMANMWNSWCWWVVLYFAWGQAKIQVWGYLIMLNHSLVRLHISMHSCRKWGDLECFYTYKCVGVYIGIKGNGKSQTWSKKGKNCNLFHWNIHTSYDQRHLFLMTCIWSTIKYNGIIFCFFNSFNY